MSVSVTAELQATITQRCRILWSVAVAEVHESIHESLSFTADDQPLSSVEILSTEGSRFHEVIAEADGDEVQVRCHYRATGISTATLATPTPAELMTYVHPSRYCESDLIGPWAWQEFQGLQGKMLVEAVLDWVYSSVTYTSGASRGTDSAVHTLLSRTGVCRDFAHLTIAALRAMNLPARMVACYAPGLAPMEFHAIVEVWLEDHWELFDPTRRASTAQIARIATGRDAAEIAFITNQWANLRLDGVTVTATLDPSASLVER